MDSIWNLWNYVEYVESTWNLWGSVKYTTSTSQGFLFVFPPLVTFALAYSTYECHHSLDKCHTPLIQPYLHKLPTCCLHVDACLMFVVLGYISTWLLLFFLRPPFSETLSLDSIILATCFLIFLISSCLTISTSTYFSTSFIHYLCWFMDDLTLEKTHQVRNLWHWHHLKPQLVPQTRKTKVRTLTFNSKQYCFMSFFFSATVTFSWESRVLSFRQSGCSE